MNIYTAADRSKELATDLSYTTESMALSRLSDPLVISASPVFLGQFGFKLLGRME